MILTASACASPATVPSPRRESSAMPEAVKEKTSAEELGDPSSEAKRGTEGKQTVVDTAQGGEPSSSHAANKTSSAINAAGEEDAISASAGEDSSTSSSPPEDNPIRGTSSQRQIVRRMCRGLYERPWHADDLLWNLSQNRLTSMATARVGIDSEPWGDKREKTSPMHCSIMHIAL